MKKISDRFHKQSLTITMFLVSFAGIALKLEKVGPTFSTFNPCSSLPSVASDDRKQFRWTIISEIHLLREKFTLFKKIANSVTYPLSTRMTTLHNLTEQFFSCV